MGDKEPTMQIPPIVIAGQKINILRVIRTIVGFGVLVHAAAFTIGQPLADRVFEGLIGALLFDPKLVGIAVNAWRGS